MPYTKFWWGLFALMLVMSPLSFAVQPNLWKQFGSHPWWRSSVFLAGCSDGMSTPVEDFRHRLTARSFQKSPSHPASYRERPHVAHHFGMA
jgi:hypothetical protein